MRDGGLGTATSLIVRTLPYALARFAVLLGAAVAAVAWLGLTFGGAAWLGEHVAGPIGFIWLVAGLVAFAFVWFTGIRYLLHLMACGHVAVLTELIVRGQVGDGATGMVVHGLRTVKERFGEASALFALGSLVRGVVREFNRTLDWIDQTLPLPGLEPLVKLVEAVLRMATTYLDKAIFSYNLARGDPNPWRSGRDGLVYYCQNARPILTSALWILAADVVLTVILWVVMLAPAIPLTLLLPPSLRAMGSIAILAVAALLAWAARGAFLKPLLLAMVTVRFHAMIEGQPIDPGWDARLGELSGRFGELRRRATAWGDAPAPPQATEGGRPGFA